jgi:hypothetical protein
MEVFFAGVSETVVVDIINHITLARPAPVLVLVANASAGSIKRTSGAVG